MEFNVNQNLDQEIQQMKNFYNNGLDLVVDRLRKDPYTHVQNSDLNVETIVTDILQVFNDNKTSIGIMNTEFKNEKLKNRFIIGSFGIAILFMAFWSFGSFNPLDVGFYTSIGAAVLWYYFSYYGFMLTMSKRR